MTKERYNRRGFFGVAGAGLAAAVGWPWLGGAPSAQAQAVDAGPESPDLIAINAKVYTVDDRMPKAEAFAVRNGRFVAVGNSDEVKSLAGKGTEIFDAQQMTIVPGFIDSHNHAPGNMLLYEVLVGNPYVVEFVTIASIVQKLHARALQTPPDYWVDGYFFDDTKLKDKRALNVHDLDQASTDRPICVHHRGGHTSFYNSKAFEMAGVTKNTANPPGGTFDRDANGELNGRVTDNARSVFDKVGKRPTYTEAESLQRDRDGLAYISKQFVRYGLTSVCHEGGNLMALQQVRERGDLLHRVSYEPIGGEPYAPSRDVLNDMIAAGLMTGFGDEWIRVGANCEHTCDGSFSERTMSRSTPYPGTNPPYYGNITTTQDALNGWAEHLHRAGIQVNCHANGDVAIKMVLTAYERAMRLYPRPDTRPKITHCTLIDDEIIRRMKAIGAIPAVFNTYLYYNSDKFHFYGETLMEHSLAFRTFLDAGIPTAAGSDFPPGPFDPRMAIQGMVTRKGWDGETWGANQKVSIDEAIRINTLNGAFDTHEEAIKGSISADKLADYVVLADDPHTIDVDKIKDIEIVRTVVGGKTKYQA
jgi:predicted amidohydrolase YtcJ